MEEKKSVVAKTSTNNKKIRVRGSEYQANEKITISKKTLVKNGYPKNDKIRITGTTHNTIRKNNEKPPDTNINVTKYNSYSNINKISTKLSGNNSGKIQYVNSISGDTINKPIRKLNISPPPKSSELSIKPLIKNSSVLNEKRHNSLKINFVPNNNSTKLNTNNIIRYSRGQYIGETEHNSIKGLKKQEVPQINVDKHRFRVSPLGGKIRSNSELKKLPKIKEEKYNKYKLEIKQTNKPEIKISNTISQNVKQQTRGTYLKIDDYINRRGHIETVKVIDPKGKEKYHVSIKKTGERTRTYILSSSKYNKIANPTVLNKITSKSNALVSATGKAVIKGSSGTAIQLINNSVSSKKNDSMGNSMISDSIKAVNNAKSGIRIIKDTKKVTSKAASVTWNAGKVGARGTVSVVRTLKNPKKELQKLSTKSIQKARRTAKLAKSSIRKTKFTLKKTGQAIKAVGKILAQAGQFLLKLATSNPYVIGIAALVIIVVVVGSSAVGGIIGAISGATFAISDEDLTEIMDYVSEKDIAYGNLFKNIVDVFVYDEFEANEDIDIENNTTIKIIKDDDGGEIAQFEWNKEIDTIDIFAEDYPEYRWFNPQTEYVALLNYVNSKFPLLDIKKNIDKDAMYEDLDKMWSELYQTKIIITEQDDPERPVEIDDLDRPIKEDKGEYVDDYDDEGNVIGKHWVEDIQTVGYHKKTVGYEQLYKMTVQMEGSPLKSLIESDMNTYLPDAIVSSEDDEEAETTSSQQRYEVYKEIGGMTGRSLCSSPWKGEHLLALSDRYTVDNKSMAIVANKDWNVYLPLTGKVTVNGNEIFISNVIGSEIYYCTMTNVNITEDLGDEVISGGTLIGKVASTGTSQIKLTINAQEVNPQFYFTMFDWRFENTSKYAEDDSLSEERLNLIKTAETCLGFFYYFGGKQPLTSFDCSGFVCHAYRESGVENIVLSADGIKNVSTPVQATDLKAGDLIFFHSTYGSFGSSFASHIGIVIDPIDKIMIHCGDPIEYTSYATSYWQSHFLSFGKIITD